MKNQKLKIGFIIVLYKTPEKEVRRLRLEIGSLKLDDYRLYFIDNTVGNRGYAGGVNEGIRQALIDNCELLIVGNPDISLKGLDKKNLLETGEHFDIWGYAMKMHGKTYYGGGIYPMQLSGFLWRLKPRKRFSEVNWVSGSLICIKKKVIDAIGLFDENYFMYYEDVDYCLRARKAGLRVGIDSKIIYDHFEISKSNSEKERLLSEARQKFFTKYASFWQKMYEFMRSGFFVNFFSLNISSFINKVLNFALYIFLIRFLKPHDYGIYTLVWAQSLLFSPIADLGTTSYGIIHLSKEKKEKFISLFNLRLTVSIAVFLLTIFVGNLMFKNNSRIIDYILLTSFVIFSNMLSGSYLIKNSIEGKLYKSSLISFIFNVALILALIVSLIFLRSLPVIFILIFLFYNLYSVVNYILVKKSFKNFFFTIDRDAWKEFLTKSYVYVLIAFLSGIYFKLDIFMLQILKGETDVGIYSAGYKFFESLMFIAASYNLTRTPMFTKLLKKGMDVLVNTMRKDIILLATIGFSIAIVTYFFSPYALSFFLRDRYQDAIPVIRIVIFALPFILVSSVFLNVVYVLKKAKYVIGIFLTQTLVNFALNIIYIPKYSYMASSYITVLSEMLNLGMLLIIFYFIKKKYYENIA